MACFLPNAVHLMQFSLFHVCCGWFDVVEHLRRDVQENEESDNSYILRCTGNGIVLLNRENAWGTVALIVSARPWPPYWYTIGIDAGGRTGCRHGRT
jgi:hypothetical protein